jgi:hypothetical protein
MMMGLAGNIVTDHRHDAALDSSGFNDLPLEFCHEGVNL